MAALLLDTNVVSATARADRNPTVVAWIARQSPNDIFLSTVTFGELTRGVELLPPSRYRTQLANWLDNDVARRFEDRILAFDLLAAAIWRDLMARAERNGRPRAPLDVQIAAIAIRHGMTLATRNTRDFAGTGVDLVNPWTE